MADHNGDNLDRTMSYTDWYEMQQKQHRRLLAHVVTSAGAVEVADRALVIAVTQAIHMGVPMVTVAKHAGISRQTCHRWYRREYGAQLEPGLDESD